MLLLLQSLQGNEYYRDYNYYYFYTEEDCDRQCTFCDMAYNSSSQTYYWKGDEFFCKNTPGLTDEETVLVAVLVPVGIFIILVISMVACQVSQRKRMLNEASKVTTTKTVVQQTPIGGATQSIQIIQQPAQQYQPAQQVIYTQQPQQVAQIQSQVIQLPPIQQAPQQVYYQPQYSSQPQQYVQTQDINTPPVL